MTQKKQDPDSDSGETSAERGRFVAGVGIVGTLLVVVLAMLMACMVMLLRTGVPLWTAVAVSAVLCAVAVVMVRRATDPSPPPGRGGWLGRVLRALIMMGPGSGAGQ
ncbi:hypothetical protein ACFP2T_13190 [Plantactinospora solaniradicis]|uniref:DUF3040 domain-containing protein n=1 Tax=Plantactinospora solaniradicis TaxID=1723736 RepID=A0ABW1K6F9_9ACTN